MTNISIPLSAKLLEAVEKRVNDGDEESKSSLVRKAIQKYLDDKVFEEILLAQQEIKDGNRIRGDIRNIAKKFN